MKTIPTQWAGMNTGLCATATDATRISQMREDSQAAIEKLASGMRHKMTLMRLDAALMRIHMKQIEIAFEEARNTSDSRAHGPNPIHSRHHPAPATTPHVGLGPLTYPPVSYASVS